MLARAIRLSAVASAALLFGCAADTAKTAKIYAEAKSCCSSLAALPQPMPGYFEQDIPLLPSTPHFDFGLGLAPFARLTVEPGHEKVVEIRAYAETSHVMLGGDGTLHYADVRVAFFDKDGKSLPAANGSKPMIKGVGFAQRYVLASDVKVPAETAVILVTTNPGTIGTKGASTVHVPAGGIMLGSTFVMTPGGGSRMRYTLSPYGTVAVLIFGAPSKK